MLTRASTRMDLKTGQQKEGSHEGPHVVHDAIHVKVAEQGPLQKQEVVGSYIGDGQGRGEGDAGERADGHRVASGGTEIFQGRLWSRLHISVKVLKATESHT